MTGSFTDGGRRGRPLHVPLVGLQPTHAALRAELQSAFERVLTRGKFAADVEVETFEGALADRLGVEHAVGVASGTAALHLALTAAGVGPGDEVILPANTFFATAEAVVATGALPVFADVRAETAGIDPASVEACITPRTAAIIAVHLYGIPAEMGPLRSLATSAGVFLLEDAAQALGASWDGSPVGALGDAAAFSFYPTKNLGALGEGGAVTTNDTGLAERVARLRSHGEVAKNVHVAIGFNERLHELQAAFLTTKLAHLDRDLRARADAVARYRSLLGPVPGVRALGWPEGAMPAHHLFVVDVVGRDAVLEQLRRNRIEAAVHYPVPIHLQPACRYLNVKEGELPTAEALARSILSLPLFPGITDEQIGWCCEVLTTAVEQAA